MSSDSDGIFDNHTHAVLEFVIQDSAIDSQGALEVPGYLTFHVEKVLAYQSLVSFLSPPTYPNEPVPGQYDPLDQYDSNMIGRPV